MNQKVYDAAKEFEEIYSKLSTEISILQVFNEDKDLKEAYEAYYRNSRKELLELLKKFFREESSNDFVILFGVYCNFYLKRGFHQNLPEEDFGVSELWNVITDDEFQRYLLLIQQGIDKQQEKFFEDALILFDEYSLPHLYLFIFAAQKYDLATSNESSNEQKKFLESAQVHYNKMNLSMREYSLGIGKFIFKSAQSDDRNLLPFVKAVDIYSELVIYATGFGAMNPLFSFDPFLDKLVEYLKILTGKQLTEKQRSDFENLKYELKGITCSSLQRLDKLLNVVFCDENINLSKTPAEWRNALPPFNLAYLKIPLKISNAGRFLLDQMEKLKLQDEKLKLQEKQEKLVAGFTHRYKNLRATQLGNIAQSLLRMENEQEKNWGRALLLEQARKETMNKEVTMLTLHYEGNAVKLVNILIDSLADDDKGIDISAVLQTTVLNCFVEFFYAKKGDSPRMRARVEDLWNDLDAKKISFEREVIFDKKNCIDWMKENGFQLQIEIDERWQKISLQEDDYAEVFLRDIFLEMLKNFLKYGRVTESVELKLYSDSNTLKISMKNLIATKFADDLKESTNKGLITMDDTLKSLYEGKLLRVPESCVHHIQSEETFFIELKMPAEIFLKGENPK